MENCATYLQCITLSGALSCARGPCSVALSDVLCAVADPNIAQVLVGGKTFLLGQLLQKLLHLLSHPQEAQDLIATVPCLPCEADPVPPPAAALMHEPRSHAPNPVSRVAQTARAGSGLGSTAEAGTQPAAPSDVLPATAATDSAGKPASSLQQAEALRQPIKEDVGAADQQQAGLRHVDLMVTEGPSSSQEVEPNSKAKQPLAGEQSADVPPPSGPVSVQAPERLSAASGKGKRASEASKGGNTARPGKRRRSELEAPS